jgi:hypothetical protein
MKTQSGYAPILRVFSSYESIAKMPIQKGGGDGQSDDQR